jgi:hypothetical protein
MSALTSTWKKITSFRLQPTHNSISCTMSYLITFTVPTVSAETGILFCSEPI